MLSHLKITTLFVIFNQTNNKIFLGSTKWRVELPLLCALSWLKTKKHKQVSSSIAYLTLKTRNWPLLWCHSHIRVVNQNNAWPKRLCVTPNSKNITSPDAPSQTGSHGMMVHKLDLSNALMHHHFRASSWWLPNIQHKTEWTSFSNNF